MGSDKKVDQNSYQPEFPQRKVYLDAYEIDKYEVTTVQFLKFVLATNRDPLDRLAIRRRQFPGNDGQPSGHARLMVRRGRLLQMGRQAIAYFSRVGKGRAEARMDASIPGAISRRD